MKKKKLAVFTHVRDERGMLPLWIKHYAKHVPKEDIYIIDHDTVDGSTSKLDVEVIKVFNGAQADEVFKTQNVMAMQRTLFSKYEYVLYVDADEIVFPGKGTLPEFLKDSEKDVFVYKAWEPIEVEGEEPLDWSKPLLQQRPNGVWHDIVSKPVLAKVPLRWCWGQHHSDKQQGGIKNATEGLYGIHLHRIDKELSRQRHIMRSSSKISENNIRGELSTHWNKTEGSEFEEWYYDFKGLPLETAPDFFKEVL